MLVEFFGPSCAGKSTLISGVQHALEKDGIPVSLYHGEAKEGGWTRTIDMARGLTHARIMLWFVLNVPQILSVEGRQFLRASGLVKRLQVANSVVILDEGPLKRISILARRDTRYSRLLIRGAPKPDLAVLVECDFNIRLQRLRAVGREFSVGTTDQELRARDLMKTKWNSRIVAELDMEVIRLDTSCGEDYSPIVAERIRHRVVRSEGG